MNLKSLKKVDPYIVSIEGHSGQVALYKFNGGKQDWEKTQVEGTLFVYKREADPQYGFTIMNRLSMNNLVEPVTKDLDFQLQTPFLLYRNHANDIFGIWFYEQAECERVGKKIEELVKVVTEDKKMKPQVTGKGGDLQQLFKKAEASKTKENPSAHSDVSGKNLLRLLSGQDGVISSQPQPLMEGITPTSGPEKASNSVQDFFAKAAVSSGDTSSAFTSVPAMFSAPPLPNGVPITAMPISQGLAMGAVPVGGYQMLPPPGVTGPANPLQRLMSNPGIHSVESIEAEQRKSASPSQDEQQVNNLPPGLSVHQNSNKINALESDLKQKLHIGSSVTINNNSINHSFAPVKVKELQEEEESRGVKLLSPQAFSSGRPTQSPSPSLLRNGVSPPTSSQVTPLTQPQLVEAITFLMENDQEFVQKIHQAYVMSLNRKLATMK